MSKLYKPEEKYIEFIDRKLEYIDGLPSERDLFWIAAAPLLVVLFGAATLFMLVL